jgi:acyl carrier protein
MSGTRDVIREYLLAHSNYVVDAEELERSRNLTEDGVLDSFSLMELVGFLDDRFSIELLADDIVSENFKTLETIVALVDAKRGGVD